MRGFSAHDLLDGARFIRTAQTAPGFALLDLGEYPALVARDGCGPVHGELFDIRQTPPAFFETLDAYEDVPTLYRRAAIPMDDGRGAVTYLLQDRAIAKSAPVLTSGRFVRA